MKWIGQHIYDQISRFRNDVYLEDISTGTIASGAHLGLDSNNKIVKAADGGGDLTGITAGTGLSGTNLTGPVPTLNFDITEFGDVTPANGDKFLTLDSGGESTQLSEISELADLFAGTGLDSDAAVLSVSSSQTAITTCANLATVGTITTGVWQGTAIASAYLDADTAHLSGVQTFGGAKTFTSTISGSVDGSAATAGTVTTAAQPAIESIGTDGDTLSILSDTLLMSNTSADTPVIKLVNTTDDDQAGQLMFEKLRDDDAVASGQNLGEIWFKGQDSAQNTQNYAYIIGEIDVSTSGQESGKLLLSVANHDGGFGGAGLILTGGSEDVEIDVTVGLGANSVVTIPGDIDLAGDIDVDGTLETDALTIGGATIAAIGTTAITTLGTIGTGVWEGTAIASDQQKHVMHYQTTGYGTADGTNYDVPQQMSTNTAPFRHDSSIGADGLTAQTPQFWMRMGGGHVMPRACTLKRWTGWAASAGSGTTYLGLFKVTMTRNSSTTVSAVLLEEFSYTALGNSKNEDFDETSFTATAIAAGDIVFTAMKGVNNKTAYFNASFEVEF